MVLRRQQGASLVAESRCFDLGAFVSPSPTHSSIPSRPGRSLSHPLTDLPGLSAQDSQRLASLGLHTTVDLLRYSRTLQHQTQLAQQLQVHLRHLQKWRALADLARVPSVGCTYAGLLLHGGVPSVAQLAQQVPGQLHRHILKLQVSLIQRPDLCPNAGLVDCWIRQAKLLQH
jgi:hypothetical protein